MAVNQETEQKKPSTMLGSFLYCEERTFEEHETEQQKQSTAVSTTTTTTTTTKSPNLSPPLSMSLQNQHSIYDKDKELISFFIKEQQQQLESANSVHDLPVTRKQAVKWIVTVNEYYGFSVLTAILAINYLDRFLVSPYYRNDKLWMIQLVSVACLSLAAKVEEAQAPLLLDLQMETEYVFEAKTIQRMELLVLSTLKWKMHPVTPLSFLDHLMTRFSWFNTNELHCEFLRRCEGLLLSAISDSRSSNYLPSVLAIATMMHTIDQCDPFNSIDHKNQLLCLPKLNKEKVDACSKLYLEVSRRGNKKFGSNKRKFFGEDYQQHQHQKPIQTSPSGVIDAHISSSDCSFPEAPLFKKKIRTTQDQLLFVRSPR